MGAFWNLLEKALRTPGSVSAGEIYAQMLSFAQIAGVYTIIRVLVDFLTKHWTFRWRQALNEDYLRNWDRLRHIEGASQRIQEDTMRFAKIMESLGAAFVESVLTLIAFLPLLSQLSDSVTELPLVGKVKNSLVWVALGWALIGTVLLSVIGIRLPGLEFQNQLVEAAYRKELVYGEDDDSRAGLEPCKILFNDVRINYFRIFWNYMYFDVAKYSYLQVGVVIPFIALAPTIAANGGSLGEINQTTRAFGSVESSFQFLIRSWSTIVDLISIFKRLHQFEATLAGKELSLEEYDSDSNEQESLQSALE